MAGTNRLPGHSQCMERMRQYTTGGREAAGDGNIYSCRTGSVRFKWVRSRSRLRVALKTKSAQSGAMIKDYAHSAGCPCAEVAKKILFGTGPRH